MNKIEAELTEIVQELEVKIIALSIEVKAQSKAIKALQDIVSHYTGKEKE